VNNTTGSGTGNGPVTVSNSGTTLGGTGATQQGRVTINAGANLAPGNGGHTTAVFSVGLLTLEPSSNFLVDINGTTVGTGYDQVQVTGAGGATGATINLSNLVVTVNATLTIGDQFVILHHAGGVSGQFAQGSTVTASNGDIFSIDYAALDSNNKPYNVTLTFTAVPEPSTWVGGALVLATLAFTQRRLFVRPLKRIALWSLNKS
jgi:hypothetical protein